MDPQLDCHAQEQLIPVPRAVKTRPVKEVAADLETEFAVSPNTPLLSTEVQENVWVCGDNSRGQLGLADSKATVSQAQPIQAPGRWAAVAIGDNHAAGISCDGRLYTWGQNHKGQLGLGVREDSLLQPGKVAALADYEVKAVACGYEHTICVTHKDVLAWGSNEHGQLGLGDSAPEACPRPYPIKLLHDVMVTQVVCGKYHTICVTAQSQVYAWGNNSMGQLGLGDKRDRSAPTCVDALWALPVVQLAVGDNHSAALTTNGHMFIWGSNQYGQLGLVRDQNDPMGYKAKKKKSRPNQSLLVALMEMGIPKHKAELALEETGNVGIEVATEWLFSAPDKLLEQLSSDGGSPSSASSASSTEEVVVTTSTRVPLKGVRYIACGSFHTVAVTDDAVYSWGQGQFGALGQGNFDDRAVPTRMRALSGKDIAKVACGSFHTLLLRRDGVVYGCGLAKHGQLPGATNRLSSDKLAPLPVKVALPFNAKQAQQQGGPPVRPVKAPVVHLLAAGGHSSAFVTRGPDEIPETYAVNLLEKLQQAIGKASRKIQEQADKAVLASALKSVSVGVEMVFGSAAAISAAFGYPDRVGLNVELLEKVQADILGLFAEELPSVASENGASLSSAIADLHKFSMMQSLYKSAVHLLEDLNAHIKLLHTPERAQVLLAAAQSPLLGEHHFAKALLPRLCAIILQSPKATRHLLTKWWSDSPGALLEARVVRPMQSYLTKELMATKKLTISVMNAIKVLAKVEEANQLNRRLPPEAFYNQLISEKMDVQDHYTAWRQTQEQPSKRHGSDGPFSFCSYPFLLDPRAKSNLLHIEARFQMEQTVAHARMEQQLYGGTSRARDDDARVISGKASLRTEEAEGTGGNGRRKRSSSDGRRRERQSGSRLGLFFNIIRSRLGDSAASDSPRSPEGLIRREGSMHLPRPSECTMPGTHSDMCIVRVRRHHLVEDALDEIARQYRRDLFKPLRVHFIGEDGIDAGGVKKEFFQLLVSELLSPDYGMLVYQPESHTYWFNACSLEGEEQFMLLGLVLGLAIYNRVLLDFPLPLALYKKLLGQPVGLRDLEDMQPLLGRSLRQLLQYEGPDSVEDVFCLTFSVEMDYFGSRRSVELKPGGEDIPVSEENRHEYVELMVDYLLYRSVAWQFEAFSQGFRMLCDGPAIHLFNAQEVERLVCGNPNLDFEALERNSKYEGGFSAATPAVQWLWDIVKELSLEEKKLFLKFFTGSDRSPIGGLGALKCVIQRDGPDSAKLPTSHTCFNTLLLPEYACRTKMENLLKLAILNSEGFGLE